MTDILRPTFAEVDLGAIVSNYRLLSELAGNGRVCAVVKADAYGHGAHRVAKSLEEAGCTYFAVSSIDEGLELRSLGIEGSVIALFGIDPALSALAVAERIVPMVFSVEMLKNLALNVGCSGPTLPVHLNFDTGMGRMGISPDEVGETVEALRNAPNIKVEGVATHFAKAGLPGDDFTKVQIGKFDRILASLKDMGVDTGIVHAANSAACLTEPRARYDMCRTGIALYGALPEEGMSGAERLKPALRWVTRITLIRDVAAGTPLSYGCSWETKRRSRIATLPVGYADGFRRALSNEVGSVLVRGARAPVVGRICMDVTLVDVTGVPGAEEGDEAVLIGKSGGGSITVEEMAGWLETINYEVLCGIGRRVPRIHRQ